MKEFNIPPHTCPVIDSIIHQVLEANELMRKLRHVLDVIEEEMETIRDDNSALRSAAKGYELAYKHLYRDLNGTSRIHAQNNHRPAKIQAANDKARPDNVLDTDCAYNSDNCNSFFPTGQRSFDFLSPKRNPRAGAAKNTRTRTG